MQQNYNMDVNQKRENIATNLPPELLSNIFSRLRLSDVKVCRMVCRSWGWSASRQMAEMSYFDFKGQNEITENHDMSNPQYLLSSPMSLVAIKSLRLRKICISFSNDFMASQWVLGPIMKELVELKLYKCQIKEEDFVRILAHCVRGYQASIEDNNDNDGGLYDKTHGEAKYSKKISNLKSLELIDSLQSFQSGSLTSPSALEQPKAVDIISRILSNLTTLDISNNKSMTDDLFIKLTSYSPNLQTLIVDKISIQYHPGIYKKYYPEYNSANIYDINIEEQGSRSPFHSPNVFTFGCLLYYTRGIASELKNLSLQGTDLPDTLLQKLASIPNLKLQTLDISKNLGIKQLGMNHLTHYQGSHLKELDISLCRRIGMDYDPRLVQIFKNLPTLKKLVLKGMSFPRGFGECLSYLHTLEYLDITDSDLPTKHLADGIVKPLEDALEPSKTSPSDEQASSPRRNENKQDEGKEEGIYSQLKEEVSCAKSLRVLILSRYCKAPEQFARIVKWTPNLVNLNMEYCSLTDEVLHKIFEALKGSNLSTLNLNGCEDVTGTGFMGHKSAEILKSDSSTFLNDSDMKNSQLTLANTHLNGSIGSLRRITKLQINRTMVTDATILGK